MNVLGAKGMNEKSGHWCQHQYKQEKFKKKDAIYRNKIRMKWKSKKRKKKTEEKAKRKNINKRGIIN